MMTKIKEKGNAVERNVKIYGLDDQKLKSSKAVINTMVAELEIAMDDIRVEDCTRCLYSLNKTKVVDIKYPTFGGKPMEDFSKFEKDLKKLFLVL